MDIAVVNRNAPDLKKVILENMANPPALERLYRQHPEDFRLALEEAYRSYPDSIVLQMWRERLYHAVSTPRPRRPEGTSAAASPWREWLTIGLLTLIAGSLAKIPTWMPSINEYDFFLRYGWLAVFPILIFYLFLRRTPDWPIFLPVMGLLMMSPLYIRHLPDPYQSGAAWLACLHLPIFLWGLTGVAYGNREIGTDPKRLEFLRFTGETLLIGGLLILIGGTVVLFGVGLFSFTRLPVTGFVQEYVIIYGLAAAPLIAAHIVLSQDARWKPLMLLATRAFIPVALVILLIYLILCGINGTTPYTDRHCLNAFFALLPLLSGLIILAIVERPPDALPSGQDYLTFALAMLALLMALSILPVNALELTAGTLSPLQVAVLGWNLLLLGNLVGIGVYYGRFLSGMDSPEPLNRWVGRYCIAYVLWATVVVFGFPFLFSGGYL
ncbi:MAG: hypothetical protein D6681_05290 [Calditrichaeota bacterium]|nr:MAG: hypothetical protein D6681_05290 [Calditrichota bacterium]